MGVPWLERPLTKSEEEKYIDAVKELDNIFLVFKKDRERLKKEISDKDSKILELENKLDQLRTMVVANDYFKASITPIKVYHHKKRGNTTVKFLDGTSVTVHKMKEDADCLETAIVYAIFKKNKNYNKKLLKYLVETANIIGGKK